MSVMRPTRAVIFDEDGHELSVTLIQGGIQLWPGDSLEVKIDLQYPRVKKLPLPLSRRARLNARLHQVARFGRRST